MAGEPYDVNFCFPVPPLLESERVALIPFIPSKHTQLFVDQAILYPEIFRYLPFGPFQDADDFTTNLLNPRIRNNAGAVLFVIYDKTRAAGLDSATEEQWISAGAFAGAVGLINSSAHNLATEIGCVMVLPPFQRTHVASNAVAILLQLTLNPATRPYPSGGLGLRRVVWQANALNEASVRLAKRMGFTLEGILRWDRVLSEGKKEWANIVQLRDGDPNPKSPGRDTALLSLTWDDWESGGRDSVIKLMAWVKPR